MAAVDDADELIEQFHLAQEAFVKGNTEPVKKLLSHREDVSLNNPFCAASQFGDGENVGYEIIKKG